MSAKSEVKGRLFRAKPGDVVYSKIDVRNGAISVLPDDSGAMVFSSEFPIYQVLKEKALPAYIKLLFRTQSFMQRINSLISGGSGRKRVQPAVLESIRVPLPPIAVQEIIVSHWHAAQENLAQINSSTKTEKKALKDWLSTELGIELKTSQITKRAFAMNWQEIERWSLDYIRRKPILAKEPDKYPLVRLGQVIKDLSNGWSPKCLDRPVEGNEWGVLKLGAVSFGTFNENENKALTPGMLPRAKISVKAGDVLFVRGNVLRLTGACSYVDTITKKLMMPDLVFRAEFNESSDIEPKFLAEVMTLPFLRNQIESIATGSSPTMKKVSKPGLLNLEFPLPPLEVQESLLKHITSERKRIANERKAAEQRAAQTKIEVEEMILGHRPVLGR